MVYSCMVSIFLLFVLAFTLTGKRIVGFVIFLFVSLRRKLDDDET